MSERDIRPLSRLTDSGDLSRPPRPQTVLRVLIYLGGAALVPLAGGLLNSYVTLHDHGRAISHVEARLQQFDRLTVELDAVQRQQLDAETRLSELRARLERVCARVRCQ